MNESYSIIIDASVDFVRDLDESLEKNYEKKLNDSIRKALTTRIIDKIGEIKILFKK